jgi:hypothetical protein
MSSMESFSPLHFESTYDLVVYMYKSNPTESRLFLSSTAVSLGLGLIGSYLYASLLTYGQSIHPSRPTTEEYSILDILIAMYLW